MNTPPKRSFIIQATYLGPILSLIKGDLSERDQNLIFARNGTGKSFLARAFRYLDLYGQGEDISEAAFNLVSDEAEGGEGSFSFSRGTETLATLNLNRLSNEADADISDTIFHVFSEDFVQKELRQHNYEMQDDIDNPIAVGSENIEILSKRDKLEKTEAAYSEALEALQEKFKKEKNIQLVEKAGVRRSLAEYKEMNLESLLKEFSSKPESSSVNFASALSDLDNLKAIPADPAYPESVNVIDEGGINLEILEECLLRVTSLSSVSKEIKEKIHAHHKFYEIGTQIIEEGHETKCPFCEQDITNSNPKKIIEAYINYFSDAEEKHKRELRGFYKDLKSKEDNLKNVETQIARQKSQYDDLKRYVPSKREVSISTAEDALMNARALIYGIMELIKQKSAALTTAISIPKNDLPKHIASVNNIIEQNNNESDSLVKIVRNNDVERRNLQRKVCGVFGREFIRSNWHHIEGLNNYQRDIQFQKEELKALEDADPSSKDARERVVETFREILYEFFANKYVFDSQRFVLERGDRGMLRGAHRTLSEGEKTAIAFCWFIASIHRKVRAPSDYSKIFLVFDDPVTSMSYDFIFSIAQTLKDLNISVQGKVSINHGDIDGNKGKRPELLILTHSSYFFNISRTNRVVQDEATFSLYQDGDVHKIEKLDKYIAPFEEHLRHVFNVSKGRDPSHSTGNSVRAVLEAIGRFCRPDKSQSFQKFATFLATDQEFATFLDTYEKGDMKSILINSLCHGTYYDDTPTPEDLKNACKFTISVVEYFAPGQLEIIK